MGEYEWLVILGLLLYIAFTLHEVKKKNYEVGREVK